jgi:membrane protease YdiL (CAAX protease family)
MQIVSWALSILLAGYIGYEVIDFVPRYRRLKQAVAGGDPHARSRVYYRVFAFEWISAGLAIAALGFDWSRLNPAPLGLRDALHLPSLSLSSSFGQGAMAGLLMGMAAGTVGFIVARLRANQRGGAAEATASPSWRHRLMPDFSALLPVSLHERLLWAMVAASAGICEETVFRGWLLSILHTLGLGGITLIAIGAACFGLAHAYQGITGMIVTAPAGALFCVVYAGTGSLLAPIVLHILVDLRFALIPAPRVATPEAVSLNMGIRDQGFGARG